MGGIYLQLLLSLWAPQPLGAGSRHIPTCQSTHRSSEVPLLLILDSSGVVVCLHLQPVWQVVAFVVTSALYISLVSFAFILITVPAKAPTHQSVKFVFVAFINTTGWSQSGIAFRVGLTKTNSASACLDCATHMAEEVPQPEKMIPLAIMGEVGVGFVTSWFFSTSMVFSLRNLTEVSATPTYVPLLELFRQTLSTNAGAIILEVLIIGTGITCLVSSHTWQSHLCWSLARDRGVPGHRWLSTVDETLMSRFVLMVFRASLWLAWGCCKI